MSPASRRLAASGETAHQVPAADEMIAEALLTATAETLYNPHPDKPGPLPEARPVPTPDQESWTQAKEPSRQPREVWSAPDRAADRPFQERPEPLSGDAVVTAALRRGLPVDEAVTTSIRTAGTLDTGQWRSLCHSLMAHPETRRAGVAGAALIAQRVGLRELAWDLLRQLGPDDAARLAPAEYVRAGIAMASPDVARTAATWVRHGIVSDAPVLLDLARLLFIADEAALAAEALDAARRATGLTDQVQASIDHLAPWIEKAHRPAAPARVPAGHVSFAVLDYKAPDENVASTNIGDTVQTVASLGHLLRHEGLRLHGDAAVTEPVRLLAGRVRPEHVVPGPGADVDLTLVQRDMSRLDAVPENTWMLAYGWYMHSQFDLRFDFPFHENLQPLFVSFHINKHAVLTPTAVDYLRAHGPIGCRDWTTVHLLLNAGVPAFFSGCLTTTVDTVFPAGFTPAPAGAPAVYVDTAVPEHDAAAESVTHLYPEVRRNSFARNVRDAVDLLDAYRSRYSHVVTSRLHAFLPAWSIGADVDFRPRNDADIRFAGLLDADEAGRRAMQRRIRDVVAPAMSRILAGATRDEVYATWAATVASEVELARAVHATPVAVPPGTCDVAGIVAGVRATRTLVEAVSPRGGTGAALNIAVALDGNLRSQMEVVVAGVVRHTDRPVRVVALTRDHTPADHARLAALFPEVTFEWYSCDGIDYGPVLGMLKHITVATMDRLLLPDLLPHLDRVLYHDLDALCVVDVAELYDTDLGGAPLAARPSISYNYRHGVGNVIRSTRLLQHDPGAARDLVRAMMQRHRHGYQGFNAGILVLDLAVMRADGFTTEFVPYAERYGLNDQDVLNAYAGSRYRVLDARWNAWPTQELVTEPGLIHWAGPVKPWHEDRYILLKEHWTAAETWLAARR
ncbi:glycosyltransferase [Promicromonospora sp. MEB111]|uniref:glycosyltransferase n=1 Tax=Promicromonospora sp. MEB111 TaxID=3040301 RepID=UPI0025501A8A|nr:glycosyltransferase [Promicromonospora sp. MEB111]